MPQKKNDSKNFFISRFWTKSSAAGQKAADLFQWKDVRSQIKNADGQTIFELKSVRAPRSWSSLAIDIAASRYFRRGLDASVLDLVDRVVDAISLSGKRQKYFLLKSDLQNFSEEIKFILLSQKASFNSPVWFNVGLSEKYHLHSQSPHWIFDPKRKQSIQVQDAYKYPQGSACFIQNVEDTLEDIFELVKTEARIFKYGSGSGTNFSKLRSKYEDLETGGKSSGLISFLEVLDRGAGAIKSGGTTRRAAKMVIVDIDHPEVIDFIRWKSREETKARLLIKAGMSDDFEGPVYKSISGQNANNSVRVTDPFMRAVEKNKNWNLRFKNQKIFKRIPAPEIFEELAMAAWDCADPGIQFHDTINRWNTCRESGEIRASNPCSEFMFLDNTACNLSSLNLLGFLVSNSEDSSLPQVKSDSDFAEDSSYQKFTFDLNGFLHTARLMFIAQDILIDHASYPTPEIAANSFKFRPLGLGLAGLGAFLMRLGIPYDSELGRSWAFFLTSLLQGQAILASIELARIKGPFAEYKKNKKSLWQVIHQHSAELQKELRKISVKNKIQKQDAEGPSKSLQPLILKSQELWQNIFVLGKKYGFRNSQFTAIAPTGTIGLVMDSETTGIEPEFSLLKTKKMAGGGVVLIASQSVELGLKSLGYSAREITAILNYLVQNKTLKGAPSLRAQDLSVFACAHGDLAISWMAHVQMMAAVQPMVSGAISKTVNLPAHATPEDIKNIYMKSWQMGLKSISVYRDGSKGGQPLTDLSKNSEVDRQPKTENTNSPMKCPECGSITELRSGCYRCPSCGFTAGCG